MEVWGTLATSTMPILIAAIVLLGCAALKGVNPFDKVVLAFIWLLYRLAALMLTVARTTDSAYWALRREYRRSVQQIEQERDAFVRMEEARIPVENRAQPDPRIQSSRPLGMLPQ